MRSAFESTGILISTGSSLLIIKKNVRLETEMKNGWEENTDDGASCPASNRHRSANSINEPLPAFLLRGK